MIFLFDRRIWLAHKHVSLRHRVYRDAALEDHHDVTAAEEKIAHRIALFHLGADLDGVLPVAGADLRHAYENSDVWEQPFRHRLPLGKVNTGEAFMEPGKPNIEAKKRALKR